MLSIWTKLGNFEIKFTDAGHAYMVNDGQIVLRGVEYSSVSLHLYHQPDGSWSGRCKSDPNGFHALSASRVDWSKDASEAAKKKIKEVMIEAFVGYITDEMRLEAAVKDAGKKMDEAAEELRKAKLAVLDAEENLFKASDLHSGLKDDPRCQAEVLGQHWGTIMIKVGDKIKYRGCFGIDDPKEVVVEAMDVTEHPRDKYGTEVDEVPIGLVQSNRVLFTLSDGHWCYSEQVCIE